MYVPQGAACTQPNSQTPMDPRAITAQNNRVARVGARFLRGNVTLNSLVQQLGGVGIGDNVAGVTELASAADFRNSPSCETAVLGDGSLYGGRVPQPGVSSPRPGSGIPIAMGGTVVGSPAVSGSGTDSSADAATIAAINVADAVAAAGSGSGAAAAGSPLAGSPGNPSGAYGWWRNRRAKVICLPPQILPMMTVFPIPFETPSLGTASVLSSSKTPASSSKTPAPPGPTPPASVVPPTFPTTGNVCLDLALNYVDPSQVSQEQLDNCALAGYGNTFGIRNGPLLTDAMIAWRNQNSAHLVKIPDQKVVPITPAMIKQYGMSGLGQTPGMGPALVWIGLGSVALWAIVDSMSRRQK